MEKNRKSQVLDSIGKVYEVSENCKLEESFFVQMDKELTLLSEYFGTTKEQALFISIVFVLNFGGDRVDLRDMIAYFACNPMKILEYNEDFKFLVSSGIFMNQRSRYMERIAACSERYVLNGTIADAILNNEPMPEQFESKINDVYELLDEVFKLGEQRSDEDISTRELFRQTKNIVAAHAHFPLIQQITLRQLGTEEVYLYLYLIWQTVSGTESTEIGKVLARTYDNDLKRVSYTQTMLAGENELIQNNLLEITEARFLNEARIKLTDESLNLLKECGINIIMNKKKRKDVISPNDIPFRELIFSESEMEQLFLLKGLLGAEKFQQTQERLAQKNLPQGVTVLLHGAPGTGKTEVVKQLAKETGRELMKVEISNSKSMWFGESEKIIKQIFTNYKSFAKDCDRTPILLFNEADAIISKRRELSNSNVVQTENAIQNILLEELESFEGILIATTNLAKNLDSAFERRFLFKIQFKKPDIAIRARIWKSKMPSLTLPVCNALAEQFDFSGGEIDNILRKTEIHEIIHGNQVGLEKLMLFCSEETLGTNRAKIGFGKSQQLCQKEKLLQDTI